MTIGQFDRACDGTVTIESAHNAEKNRTEHRWVCTCGDAGTFSPSLAGAQGVGANHVGSVRQEYFAQ